jgi:hypothetical protein
MAESMWKFADRLSDKIVALVNAEIRERPDFSVAELLAGQLLALLALQRTAEGFGHPQPLPFQAVQMAAEACLRSLMDVYPEGAPRERKS